MTAINSPISHNIMTDPKITSVDNTLNNPLNNPLDSTEIENSLVQPDLHNKTNTEIICSFNENQDNDLKKFNSLEDTLEDALEDTLEDTFEDTTKSSITCRNNEFNMARLIQFQNDINSMIESCIKMITENVDNDQNSTQIKQFMTQIMSHFDRMKKVYIDIDKSDDDSVLTTDDDEPILTTDSENSVDYTDVMNGRIIRSHHIKSEVEYDSMEDDEIRRRLLGIDNYCPFQNDETIFQNDDNPFQNDDSLFQNDDSTDQSLCANYMIDNENENDDHISHNTKKTLKNIDNLDNLDIIVGGSDIDYDDPKIT